MMGPVLSETDIHAIRWLVQHARDTEWQTEHAAENSYCMYCQSQADKWQNQTVHNPGCVWRVMTEQAEKLLQKISERRQDAGTRGDCNKHLGGPHIGGA